MAEHLSDWHDFNAEDRKTYPEMNTSPVQVRFADGTTEEAAQSSSWQTSQFMRWACIK
jgi:hypothetical protein